MASNVLEVTLNAHYFGRQPDTLVGHCTSISELPQEDIDERTYQNRRSILLRGVDPGELDKLDAAEWTHWTHLSYSDPRTGAPVTFNVRRTETIEPNSARFEILN